jgi:hypothetical protein
LGLNVLPAGPYGVIFAALYQFYSIIPTMYEFKVFGVAFTDKFFMYALAAQVRTQGHALSDACSYESSRCLIVYFTSY